MQENIPDDLVDFVFSDEWRYNPTPSLNNSPLPQQSTPIQDLYGYVLPNGTMILKHLILNGVSINFLEMFPGMG